MSTTPKIALLAWVLIPSWFVLNPRLEEAPILVDGQTLANGWRSDNIGQVSKAGEIAPAVDGVVIKGSGSGVREGKDDFHFVSQQWNGDGQFIVKISDVQSPGGRGVASLMVRSSLAQDAAFVSVGFMAKGKAVLQRRLQTGSNVEAQVFGAVPKARRADSPPLPVGENPPKSRVLPGVDQVGAATWFKIERRGNLLAGFQSSDGLTWSWLGTEQISLGNTIYVGLAASSSEETTQLSANFAQIQMGTLPLTTSIPPPAGNGDGLQGIYEGKGTGGHLQRIDPTVDFTWGLGAPSPEIGKDMFTVRWDGMLEPLFSELYTLQAIGRDGMRLWIDGRLVVNLWNEQGGDPTAEIALTAGKRVHIRLDYFANYGKANIQLFWSSPSTPRQIIPQSQLYSQVSDDALTDTDGDGLPNKWELANGLDPSNPNDAALSSKGDGLSNLQRYLMGRDLEETAATVRTLSGGWQARDIGDVGAAGTTVQTGDHIQMGASGDNIQGWKDGFQFAYQLWQGDVQIIARVDSVGKVDPWAKAGVMIRADLTDRSANAFLALTPEIGPTVQERTKYSGFTDWRGWPDKTRYRWIKLVRRGNGVASFASTDGVVWEWLHHREIALGESVYVGLATCSANNTKFTTAEFSHVQISAAAPLSQPDAAAGLGDGLRGNYSDTAGAKLQRVDTQVSFDWGLGSPAQGFATDDFTVTWEGILEAPRTETYDLILQVRDRGRLWVDGEVVVDLLGNDLPEEVLPKYRSKALPLRAGHRYAIRLEYSAHNDRALAMLQWKSASIPEQPIPQRYLYSPSNAHFAQSPDQDGDGMPDAWELAYGLNPTDPKDAQDDLDGDGLNNLAEFKSGSDPRNTDSNGDGIPDGWAAKYGLEAGGEPIATQDADHDGLTNLEEFRRGTDPTKEDTDGDGLTDLEELVETGSDLLSSDIDLVQTVAQVKGSEVVGKLGDWEVDGDSIYAQSTRGYVEYLLKAPEADMYRLEVWGKSRRTAIGEVLFPLLLSIDGRFIDRKVLVNQGSVNALTPWLTGDAHRIRIYWDNSGRFHPPLQIDSVRLVSLKGKDKDGNGVSDWVDYRLKAFNGIDGGDAKVITSVVSPFCLEGRLRYPGMLALQSSGQDVTVRAGAGQRWYANVPLVPYGSAQVEASFQNGGLKQATAIRWDPLDISRTNSITIRQGDSLWLTVEGVGNADVVDVFDLSVAGLTNFSGRDKPVVVQFDQPGTYSVQGARRSTGVNRSLDVTVVGWSPGEEPAAWVARQRLWSVPKVPDGVAMESGAETSLENAPPLAETNSAFFLKAEKAVAQHVVARLGEKGSILADAEVKEFELHSGSETSLQVLKKFDDGSKFVEMGLVMSPVRPEVTVNIVVLVGGVTFDDGTLEKNLTASDFNELGQAAVRFIKSKDAVTSSCHQLRVYQNGELVGTR